VSRIDPLPRALCVMGIDPGLSGAIAWYFPDDPHLITAEDMPVVDKNIDPAALARRVKQMQPDVAIIELVGAMPKQGLSSTFKFGMRLRDGPGRRGRLRRPCGPCDASEVEAPLRPVERQGAIPLGRDQAVAVIRQVRAEEGC
jgi:hypothetical protein